MLRKILTVVAIILALIVLFFLVRSVVNSFRDDSDAKAPTKIESTVTEPIDTNGDAKTDSQKTTTTETETRALPGNQNTPAPAAAPANSTLANTGPAETATAIIAVTAALGTIMIVRRRQLANL